MEFTTIGESCTLHARIGWQGLTKSEYLDEGDYYLVTGVDFDNGHIAFDSCHFVTKERYDQDPHIQLKQSDVLVTKDGTIGKVAYIDKPIDRPATLNSGVFVVRPKDTTLLLPEYLMIMLMSDHFCRFIEQIKVGCTIAHLNQEKFLHYRFPLPLVAEQRHIIEVYYVATEIINKHQRQLCTLDQLIKARFVEMFGDMIINPLNWGERRLDSIADIVSGITKGRKVKTTELFEVPYMAVSNVKDGYIDWSTVKTILATQAEIDQYRLKPCDVLMTEGGDPDKLGRGAIIHEPPKDCIHQNHIFRVRLNQNIILPDYMAQYLQHQRAKRYFLGCAKQTTGIASINMTQLSALPVLLPSMETQKAFASFVFQVYKSKVVEFSVFTKRAKSYII